MCKKFNIPWPDYPDLTLGERSELIKMVEEEVKEAEKANRRSNPGGVTRERLT